MVEYLTYKSIGEICDIVCGQDYKSVQDVNGVYPIYGTGGIMGYASEFRCPANSVIVGRKGNINNPIFVEEPFWNVDTAFGVVPKSVVPKYFFYFCRNYDFSKHDVSVTIPSLRRTDILKIQVPIRTQIEQERIVAELDLLTEIIDKQKQQLKELDTLAQSIFYDMFGNPVENDKGWEKKQIGKICTSKKQIQRASKRFKDSDIIRYIDISSIDNINNVMTSTTSYGFGDAPSRAQQVVEIGDVLISLVRPNLNNVAMVSEDGTDLVASSGFCVLRANCEIVKEFLFYSVKMKCFTDYLMQRVSGANYPAVREDDIMGYNIILPPLELQESFAQKIQSIESQKQSINRSLAESQKLFDYTMDKYFG